MTTTRAERLKRVRELNDEWVAENMASASARFDPADRKDGSDYNLHHVELDASGAAQDVFVAGAMKILAGASGVKHLPGQHNQQDHAGLGVGISSLDIFDADEYEAEYGYITDDRPVDLGDGRALSVRVFDSGEAHVALDLPDGRRQVVGNVFHDDGMRDLADDVDRLLAVDFEDLDEDDADEDGLVDRNEGYETDVATGLYSDGDLRLAPKGGEDHVVLDRDQAEALVLALGEMAEAWELNFGGEGVKTLGLKHLLGQHDQRSHGRRGAPGRNGIIGLFPEAGKAATAEDNERIDAAFAEVINGNYPGGFHIDDAGASHVGGDDGSKSLPRGVVNFGGSIKDEQGNEVGWFRRWLSLTPDDDDPDGPPHWVAYHDRMFIDDEAAQGAGFARAFNQKMLDWYRESGIEYVDLLAGDRVGGYAWASQGFDFKNQAELERWFLEEEGQADPTKVPGYTRELYAEQRPLFDALVERVEAGEWVSAYELSQTGRKPGQGKDDWWIGKGMLLGGSFSGRMAL